MPETTICPACLTIGEVKRMPVMGVIWAIPAVLLTLLAGLWVVSTPSLSAAGWILLLSLIAVFTWLSWWSLRRDLSCESCGSRALPVDTAGGKECWDRLKAKRKPA